MLRLFVWLLLTFTISVVCSVAFGASSPAVTPAQWTLNLQFVRDNWAVIALVISELAAFLPSKWNGILQSVLSLVSAILAKKKPAAK